MESNEANITSKLKYLGLNLNKIPAGLLHFDALDYRPARNYDERSYKTYKYLDIKDIEILLTPKNRLDPIMDKYAKAVPVGSYLSPEKEEDIENHSKFLKMLTSFRVDGIEELEGQQELLNEKIPFKVKFYKDYLWQIHYSEFTNKYFMLVPTEDQEQSAFFYVLKKICEEKLEEKIFVPICYSEYNSEYLKKSEIEELEKYIWFFTKEWPLIYDVYDKKDNFSIYITGNSFIYENIQSPYCIKLDSKETAIKFYKLLKVLFILNTELPHYYNFEVKLDEMGSIEFYFDNEKISYENSSDFIKDEYVKIEKQKKDSIKDKAKLEKKLAKTKEKLSELDFEYLTKEKEITLYLECRKTFFGKVRYFFGKKKRNPSQERGFEGSLPLAREAAQMPNGFEEERTGRG